MNQNELKKRVGIAATDYIQNGMIVGLGTGSTVYYFVEELGKRVQNGLSIIGVTTSLATKQQAEQLGIPLKSLDDVNSIDLVVDGADEIDPQLNGIKGGGGALLFEKLVATQSKEVIWIVDESKMVDCLGAFPLPVEVVQYGHTHLLRYFEEKGYHPVLRMRDEKVFVTDDGNFIIDLHLKRIDDAVQLQKELNDLVGVVEHGLFLNQTRRVLVGKQNTVEVIEHV
ncbi:ribose-5-phosphate isomerase RpiA [Carnobacteriaceae bacterium zg-ZUI252]|nr:ribose-5-phosphate isomerase RpiA [Carnobacteriaceae bacterium zg-ZUI252]MBS4770552.1 ribose-5-phosphate isomerase RpiA [Carnobacteriaceae bacterium zg-ZUI240]QTU82597.1 ribose-5-phosphate isomerase RpiA [Carnobacteriaceae bacterium zg-C25]